ncbi:sulfite exporter TauE/SafE family protein [Fodinibius halophilus]|uniref:Sulfite exporter TauE/SafE family protein n=1 Tax=Fodinibius halophilus TaxID=1736908 RepID=A0A6M1TFF1_9BACT|nr:sulfite exporter TauE/SafE family protein [Fodinibius halophilus]NGP89524.1 sulfite exporter TauE/SafE family protein [Fodinibius halophilus]
MEWIIAGLTFGFLGSFHCIGMCGPIALALPRKSKEQVHYIFSRIIYNAGRITTYIILGSIAGFFSRIIAIGGYQQGLSITIGALMLLALAWNKVQRLLQRMEALPSRFISKMTHQFKRLFNNGGLSSLYTIGLLNGLLPCGFVYMGLATAITFGSIYSSSLFMAGFGFGTVPAMLGISLTGGLVSTNLRQKLKNLSPYFIAVVGIILILRGLGLGIPFISPAL